MTLHVDDWVEVRSREEILATLDANGRLDELPFMPHMLRFCGHRLQVIARAHKTCDVIAGENRRLTDCVHLDTRCGGEEFDGCQASCLLFWKTAWLKPVDAHDESSPAADAPAPQNGAGCTEEGLRRSTRGIDSEGETIYFCQATQVPFFTSPLAWWDLRQYVEDYTSGNATLGRIASGFMYQTYNHGTQAWRHKIGRPGRRLYDALQSARGGTPFPNKPGTAPPGSELPTADLGLQPGELVRIKSHEEILATVTRGGGNRGLLFDKEMVPFCGHVFRVRARMTRFVDERTGRMRSLKTPAVMLDGVWCRSLYSNKKMFCPRAIPSWWREVWLERIDDEEAGEAATTPAL